ncbi:MAG: prohibitin family protein [Clostridia bacterium]|nr:prohibitin family protein [Clostridia bacterium]
MKTVIGIIAAVILIVGIVLGAMSCSSVPAGSVGVQTTFGKLREEVLEPGLNWKSFTTKVNKVSVANTTKMVDTLAFTKDIQEVSIKITVVYRVAKEDAKAVFVNYGEHLFEHVTHPTVLSEVKAVISGYTAQELIEKRGILGDQCLARLQEAGSIVTFVGLNITDIDFTDAYTNAIEAKQVSEQELLAQKTRNDIEQSKAENAAELKRIAAEGDASALLTKAAAEAEANRILQESITELLLRKLALDKWDGKLPIYGGSFINGLVLGETE